MDLSSVVAAVRGEPTNRSHDLVHESGEHLGVSHAAVREFSGEHAPRFVHGDVELPPATPSPFSPLRSRPLALADDAETSGVHDEVHRLGRQESAQLDL